MAAWGSPSCGTTTLAIAVGSCHNERPGPSDTCVYVPLPDNNTDAHVVIQDFDALGRAHLKTGSTQWIERASSAISFPANPRTLCGWFPSTPPGAGRGMCPRTSPPSSSTAADETLAKAPSDSLTDTLIRSGDRQRHRRGVETARKRRAQQNTKIPASVDARRSRWGLREGWLM